MKLGGIDFSEAAARCWDVLVIGAGPAGSLAAYQLARRGRSVLLIDKNQFPRDKVCGGCLAPKGLQHFESIGLGDLVWSLGAVPTDQLCWVARGRMAQIPLAGGCSLSRRKLDLGLAKAAIDQGASLLAGASARLFQPSEDGRAVLVQGPAEQVELQGRVVVWAAGLARGGAAFGADADNVSPGSHLGAGLTLGPGQLALDIPNRSIQMVCGTGGYVGIVRVEEHRLNIAAALAPDAVKNLGGMGGAVSTLMAEAGLSPPDHLADAPWRGTPLLTRRTSQVAAERLLLVGDATGYVEPFTGEGMSWAIADAIKAAELVDQGIDHWSPAVARMWSDWHRREAAVRQRTCRWIARLLRSPRITTATIALLRHWPRLARPFVAGLGHAGAATGEAT